MRINDGRKDPTSQWAQDVTEQVKLRNRYLNVQPWDKSRIQLKVPEGKLDYINASPISLKDPRTGTETKYIVTQVSSSAKLQLSAESWLNEVLPGSQAVWHRSLLANDMA